MTDKAWSKIVVIVACRHLPTMFNELCFIAKKQIFNLCFLHISVRLSNTGILLNSINKFVCDLESRTLVNRVFIGFILILLCDKVQQTVLYYVTCSLLCNYERKSKLLKLYTLHWT